MVPTITPLLPHTTTTITLMTVTLPQAWTYSHLPMTALEKVFFLPPTTLATIYLIPATSNLLNLTHSEFFLA